MKTISLTLAKQLKEANFPVKSEFEWEIGTDNKPYLSRRIPEHFADESRYFPAPTADEIIDILPAFTHLPYFLYIWKDDAGLYRIVYCSSADLAIGSKKPNYPVEKQKSLAEAAGLMYLYLKKEKLL